MGEETSKLNTECIENWRRTEKKKMKGFLAKLHRYILDSETNLSTNEENKKVLKVSYHHIINNEAWMTVAQNTNNHK